MTRRQLAVPVVAALLGSAVTAAVMLAGGNGTGTIANQQGLLSLEPGERLSSTEIYDRAAPGVVAVRANSVQPAAAAFQADPASDLNVTTGSGFVLDGDGRIVTNAHVVSGVTAVQVTFPEGPTVAATVVGKDEETDLAVLSVPPRASTCAPSSWVTRRSWSPATACWRSEIRPARAPPRAAARSRPRERASRSPAAM